MASLVVRLIGLQLAIASQKLSMVPGMKWHFEEKFNDRGVQRKRVQARAREG